MSTNFPSSLDTYTLLVENVDDVLASHANDRGDAIEAAEAKIGINSSTVAASHDYFLKHASGEYRTHTHTGGSDDGALIPVSNLSGVAIVGLSNEQYLRYNSVSGDWENYTLSLSLDNLNNVAENAPSSREGIYYNGASWESGYPNAVYAS